MFETHTEDQSPKFADIIYSVNVYTFAVVIGEEKNDRLVYHYSITNEELRKELTDLVQLVAFNS
jgi:hypothetical protein